MDPDRASPEPAFGDDLAVRRHGWESETFEDAAHAWEWACWRYGPSDGQKNRLFTAMYREIASLRKRAAALEAAR